MYLFVDEDLFIVPLGWHTIVLQLVKPLKWVQHVLESECPRQKVAVLYPQAREL